MRNLINLRIPVLGMFFTVKFELNHTESPGKSRFALKLTVSIPLPELGGVGGAPQEMLVGENRIGTVLCPTRLAVPVKL